MRFFLDTGSIDEIRAAKRLGILAGVTTNPSLLAKEKGNRTFRETVREICEIVQGPVSAEVVADNADEMIREGREIMTWHEHVVIKVPIGAEGLVAISTLASEGAKINTTLIFSANQALLAARAGATYVSPFIGRLDDISQDGLQLIRDCSTMFRMHQIETKVLAASLRGPTHVFGSALAGADVATMPYKVLLSCLTHPLTDAGFKRFTEDWKASGLSIFEMARTGD
ncbi:MAG: fructose-6-phosphate aldolase [Chloroflexi bacterium]|nr:fructose-6-phosphate aldolase [Chloroflexota bacterium]